MSSPNCNVDLDHPCDGGEDGAPCESCAEYIRQEEAYWKRQWVVASPAERDPEGYRRDMIEAGRGHLL